MKRYDWVFWLIISVGYLDSMAASFFLGAHFLGGWE